MYQLKSVLNNLDAEVRHIENMMSEYDRLSAATQGIDEDSEDYEKVRPTIARASKTFQLIKTHITTLGNELGHDCTNWMRDPHLSFEISYWQTHLAVCKERIRTIKSILQD